MYWNLVDEDGRLISSIVNKSHYVLAVVNDEPLEFHGTKDFIDGIIIGIQLMGGRSLHPRWWTKQSRRLQTSNLGRNERFYAFKTLHPLCGEKVITFKLQCVC
jgi:hypothetical protein